ncbi:hypothetical protein BC936DRAFT_144236 [Jimgerdemannia flammicorona]|uniref:Uncharacterized protein n=1 Tax=Jimgerdemannia flammicorona TaxID=994334 RepID=A0A433DCW0_9FUNG|nr:hypothetical protein BC936DRAFT_144236 [Jimgerdemannia flammicorona]
MVASDRETRIWCHVTGAGGDFSGVAGPAGVVHVGSCQQIGVRAYHAIAHQCLDEDKSVPYKDTTQNPPRPLHNNKQV